MQPCEPAGIDQLEQCFRSLQAAGRPAFVFHSLYQYPPLSCFTWSKLALTAGILYSYPRGQQVRNRYIHALHGKHIGWVASIVVCTFCTRLQNRRLPRWTGQQAAGPKLDRSCVICCTAPFIYDSVSSMGPGCDQLQRLVRGTSSVLVSHTGHTLVGSSFT